MESLFDDKASELYRLFIVITTRVGIKGKRILHVHGTRRNENIAQEMHLYRLANVNSPRYVCPWWNMPR